MNDITDALNSVGKAQRTQGESLQTFLASLVTSVIVCSFFVILHVYFKPNLPQLCSEIRADPTLAWQTAAVWPRMIFFPMPDPDPDKVSRLENYLFDRYIHTILRIFILLTLTLLPILLPLNIFDGKNDSGGIKGLDRLSFANVGLLYTDRYWAHLLEAVLVVVVVCLIIQDELQNYTRFQLSFDAAQLEGSSILLVSTSKEQLTLQNIQKHFGTISGGIKTVQMNRDFGGMYAKIRQREKLVAKLEGAETNLIRKANRSRRRVPLLPKNSGIAHHTHSIPLWEKYLHNKERPSMRLPVSGWDGIPSLPFVGSKVDTIHYCRSEIVRCSIEIEQDQQRPYVFPLLNSAFIHFNHQLSTPLAVLALKSHIPPSWTIKHRTTGTDIIWPNLSISWWEQLTRTIIVYTLLGVLILGFAVPVIFTGSLSQIVYLANITPALASINKLPNWLLAFLQGVFPTIILALSTAIVPTALRLLAHLRGLCSQQAVEKSVQHYFFTFLFIQVFLVVSMSSSITAVIDELRIKVESMPAILAQNLPKASNYFFSYVIIHTAATVTGTLVDFKLWMNLLLSRLLDRTARQKWMRMEDVRLRKWGTFVPVYTNLACIGLVYSVIAPLILIFTTIGFGALWILYRSKPPKLSDSALASRGQFYPTAMRQLFTGLYFMELCLIGLFFLVRDADNKANCTRQAIIMTFVTFLTLIFNCTMGYKGSPSWRSIFTKYGIGFFFYWKEEKMKAGQYDRFRRANVQLRNVINIESSSVATRCVIWIPRDDFDVAANEIHHMRKYSEYLVVSSEGAYLDGDGRIVLQSGPPE